LAEPRGATIMLVIGIDGGATRTRALALDTSSWRCEGIVVNEGSNPVNTGAGASARVIRRVVDELLRLLGRGLGDVDLVLAGLAGLDSGMVKAEVEPLLRKHSGLGDKLVLEHDAYIALLSATRGEPGVLVIAGTGSIVLGYDGENRVIMGDRGWLLGDEGSGFWIARLALRRLRRALDGLAPHDCLTLRLSESLGVHSSDELMYWFYHHNRVNDIASTALHVAEIADECQPAREIVEKGARILARLAARAALLIGVGEVYGAGSLFRSKVFSKTFRARLSRLSGARLVTSEVYPVLGALYEALRLTGYPGPEEVFTEPSLRRIASKLYH